MKIVIVLCSLATFAIAVPVYQENVIESSLGNQASNIKRERKSALPEITPGLSAEHGTEKNPIHSSKKLGQGTSLEAKSFRRPIIIKRKLGYHVYRDSDEEMAYAEPGEKCREQVKFKLCDHEPVSNSKNGFKSPTFKCLNSHSTDNEMGNSIKMAKEAVEHLQKDLKRMENFSAKMVNPNIEDIESNTGLHHDIEIAREALEHIEQNFESVNLEVNKVNDLQIPKSQDEERLTRWREAIENIHKNFAIVKNIEDAFKSDNHLSLFRSDSIKAVESEEPERSEGHVFVQHKFTNDNLENNEGIYNEDKILKSASSEDGIVQLTPKTEDISNIDAGNDMFVFPTENREEKILHSDSLKSEINFKDTSLRSDVSEIESTKHETNVPKESIEYALRNSNSLSESNPESKNENSPLERPGFMPQSTNIESSKNSEVGEDEIKYSDKYNHKEVENKSKSYNMRLSNDQLEKTELLSADNFKYTDKYKNTKSSEIQDGQIGSRMSENQELNKLSFLNDDSLKTADQKEPQLYKTVSATSKEPILNYRDKFANQYGTEEEMGMIITQNKDANEDPNWKFSKSVPELPFDLMVSMPKEKVVINDNQHAHKEEVSMRSSENQNDKMILNNNQEVREPLPIGIDIERYPEESTWQLFKSVPDLPFDPMASRSIEKVDITDDQNVHKGEESMRTAENRNDKMQSNQNQEVREPLSTGLDIERYSEERSEQYSKSVPELQLYPKASLPLDITNDRQSHNGEASMRSAENTNEESKFEETQDVPLAMRLDSESHPEERTWQSSKSVPELPYAPMVLIPREKVDITDDQHFYDRQASMRMSLNQNEKLKLTDYQEEPEHSLTSLDKENDSDDTKIQFLKSVPEKESHSTATFPSDEVETNNNLHLKGEEVSMKSADGQNDKNISNENKEVHKSLPLGLNTKRHPEERTWQYSEDVPEMPYSMGSIPMENVDITDDQHTQGGEASMRSSESQSEKLQLNKNQEPSEHASTILNIGYNSDNSESQFFKSVPELQLYPIASLPSDKVDITNDQQSYIEEASVRSAEIKNDKMQSNEFKEVHESLPIGLDFERHPDERTWQYSKSVPELPNDPMVSMATEKIDITDHEHAPKEEESMRSSENQNDKMQLNVFQDKPEYASTTLNIENNSDDTKTPFLKSASELQPMPTDKVDITNDKQSNREGATMRSSETQNDKMESNEYKEVHESLPMGSDFERHPDERTWQYSKSVPELPNDPMVSMATEKIDITDHEHAPKEEESMRSSENQNNKMQLNVFQDKPEYASTTLNIENNYDDTKTPFLKSASELQPMPTDKVDITNDKQSNREGATMRSSETQNDKMESNEYKEVHESLPMGSDFERHPDERTWQYSKSVPELPNDPMVSMATEKIDITDHEHAPKEEESMRSSENQNDKMQLNVFQDKPEYASTTLNIENNSDDTKTPFLKSASELQPMPTDKVDITNDKQSNREGATMRSSETQNDKMQSNDNQEVHGPLPMVLDIERHPEERTWQNSKSVPELSYDPIVSRPTEQLDITDDQHAHKGEVSMKTAENQNDKMQSNENKELLTLPSGLDNERHPEELNLQYSKSVPELSYDAMVSMPTEKVDVIDDQHAYEGEESMRSSENQNDKMQSNENQEVYEPLSTGLDIERHPEEHIEQYSKSVPEMPYDSMVSGKVDIINDQYYKGDASTRVSETENEKFQLNDHKEEPAQSSTRFDIESNVENQKSKVFKSVPELNSDPLVSLPTDKVDINNGQYFYKEKADMRLTQTQNEKLQLNEIKESHEPIIMRLDMTNQPEEQKWQFSKSVPEWPYDPMVSIPTDKVEIINEQHSLKEGNMRLSQIQNEGTQFQESHGLQDFFPTKLGIENHPKHSASQFLKSAPELHMTRSNINHANNENFYFPENSRLAQNQNEGQQIYQHYYEPLSSRLDDEKKLEDDSLSANKVRFSYIPNPMKEQTNMRLSQNENKEIQYPSTSFGLNKEHMNRDDNAERIMNDNMHRSLAQHQQLHENRNSMLRSSNERQHLNHNYNSWPEYKMLPSTSQFEYRDGHLFNEHPNMRINEQQSRDPEPIENQNLHNSLSMLWNTENQHQDPSPKTFKSNLDFDHTLHKSNEYDNQQFFPHEVSKPGNALEYRTRAQLFGDHVLDDTQSSRWYQTNQHNDHFANYYKTIPEVHEEYMNPHFRKHLHRVAVNHKLTDADTFSTYDFPSSSLHDHMQKYHQEKSSNIDSSMEPGMHMNMREPFAKSGTEFNNMHFNNPHGTPRFGAGLPIAGVNSGAVGVFPTANAGGCGIPLLLSCSPSVVSGSLARQHIVGPVLKSVDENFKYYMKRDVKNIADVPDIKIQKASFPHHGTGATSEISNS